MIFSGCLLILLICSLSHALNLAELRQRSVYQVLTDRFARSDGLVTPCDAGQRRYCGGTWKGIEQRLGYIQNMGFDTSRLA